MQKAPRSLQDIHKNLTACIVKTLSVYYVIQHPTQIKFLKIYLNLEILNYY